jgi:hypothetical protein
VLLKTAIALFLIISNEGDLWTPVISSCYLVREEFAYLDAMRFPMHVNAA